MTENTEVVVDPVEEQARQQGWVNQEEWVAQGKDAKDHRTAKEFVDRGELYKSIHSTKRELQQTKAALDSLARHHQFVYEKAFQDADARLRQELRAAKREGDHDAAEQIEQEREQLKTQHVAQVTAFQKEQAMARGFNNNPPELDAWLDRNPWYETDVELKEQADAFGRIYLRKGGSREGFLEHVEKKMKEHIAKQNQAPAKKTAQSPVGEPNRSVRQTTSDNYELSELENKIMTDLVRSGVMTKDEYVKQLKEAKGVN